VYIDRDADETLNSRLRPRRRYWPYQLRRDVTSQDVTETLKYKLYWLQQYSYLSRSLPLDVLMWLLTIDLQLLYTHKHTSLLRACVAGMSTRYWSWRPGPSTPEMRPRRWPHQLRPDRDKILIRLETTTLGTLLTCLFDLGTLQILYYIVL